MNAATVFLAIICIWSTDATQTPQLEAARAPSLAVCQANNDAMKAKLEADPAVRFVSTSCVSLERGEKS